MSLSLGASGLFEAVFPDENTVAIDVQQIDDISNEGEDIYGLLIDKMNILLMKKTVKTV